MIEVIIDRVGVSLMNYHRVVLLKEKAAERYLPIWVGPAEADAIAVKLQGTAVSRPMSHDLLCSVIDRLGAGVNSIIINDLRDDTFYGKIVLSVADREIEVDSRPSDALALAVRAEVPILAEEAVLDKAGILLDQKTGRPISQSGTGEENTDQDDSGRPSAFADFLDTLNMDDFDQEDK